MEIYGSLDDDFMAHSWPITFLVGHFSPGTNYGFIECKAWVPRGPQTCHGEIFTGTLRSDADGMADTNGPMTDPWCWYINANIKGVY